MAEERVQILWAEVDPVDVCGVHRYLAEVIECGGRSLVLNVNVHALNLGYEQPWLRDFLNRAPLVFCDGMGVVLGARLLGEGRLPRFTFADWVWTLGEFAAAAGYSLFFLGARPGVAERAAAHLSARFPALQIAGVHHGYFNKGANSRESLEVIRQINAVRPNILIVGFGMPLQERWLRDHWANIDANVALTGGAVFDYLSGDLQRPPKWMTEHYLEWLGRLLIEPRRLWRRYLIGNSLFLWRVMQQRARISCHLESPLP